MRLLKRKRPVLCRLDGCIYPRVDDRYCLAHRNTKRRIGQHLLADNLFQRYGRIYERQ